MLKYLHRLRRDENGSYAIEFALIMPTFLMLVMGTFDLGMQMYAKQTLAGVVAQAARDSTLESNVSDTSAVDDRVRERMGVVARYGTLAFTRTSYTDYNSVGRPENFTDSNGNGVRNPGECYEDVNGNSQWDADRGSSGSGGASDVVVYQATFTFPRLFPLWKMLGQDANKSIVVASSVRNQPYSNQTSSTVVRCS